MAQSSLALVVDDDSDHRALVRLLLEHAGFDVIEAENGLEGLGVLTEAEPSLVVLDLQMPVATGWDFLRERAARGLAPHAHVILCSGEQFATIPSGYPHCAKPLGRECFLGLVRDACRDAGAS